MTLISIDRELLETAIFKTADITRRDAEKLVSAVLTDQAKKKREAGALAACQPRIDGKCAAADLCKAESCLAAPTE